MAEIRESRRTKTKLKESTRDLRNALIIIGDARCKNESTPHRTAPLLEMLGIVRGGASSCSIAVVVVVIVVAVAAAAAAAAAAVAVVGEKSSI